MLDQNKKLAILSNTSSPSHVALRKLKKYGLREDMFAGGLVSSGEECAKFVRDTYCHPPPNYNNNEKDDDGDGDKAKPLKPKTPKKALWLTWKESELQNPLQYLSYITNGIIDDNNNGDDDDHGNDDDTTFTTSNGGGYYGEIDIATSVEEADFILLHGSEVWRIDDDDDTNSIDLNFLYNEDYSKIDPLLNEAAERKLPMVCANPDLVVGLPGGVVGNMPGKIANRYVSKGGTVRHFGKPNPRHFHACLENLGVVTRDDNNNNNNVNNGNTNNNAAASTKSNIPGVVTAAHVGDSLEHDIAGANAAGIDSIFVLGGIHAEELGLVPTTGISSNDDGDGEDGGGGTVIVEEEDGDGDDGGQQREVVEKGKKYIITKKKLEEKLELFFEERGIWPTHVVSSLSL